MQDSLGDRMKAYENVSNPYLMRRCPVILRFDMCHGHTFTKGFKKPFDTIFMQTMIDTMESLCKEIQGCVFGYTQSDEITLILVDYQKLDSSAWFDNRLEKMCSVGASMASRYFNKLYIENVQRLKPENYELYEKRFFMADFDCRTFNVPKEDVCNCLIWRQKDATRNSIQSVAQFLYKQKELMGLSCNQLQDKMFTEKGVNWSDLSTPCKRGTACKRDNEGKWFVDSDMPILTGDRWYIEDLIYVGEEN